MTSRGGALVASLCVALAMGGCSKKGDAPGAGAQTKGGTLQKTPSGKPLVIATTTMIADTARAIGGDAVQVECLLKPGGDPHLYQPTPSDAKLVARSQLVLMNGLHLEGWMEGLVKNAGGDRPVKKISDGVEPIRMKGSPGGVDPHFWFDLIAWQKAATNITDQLVRAVGGPGTEEGKAVAARGKAYRARLGQLHQWAKGRLATVPKPQRVLVTSHDAFNYFGRAYDMQVVGIQGTSTESAASPRDVANTIELVKKHQVKAIFVETSVNPSLIKQVSRATDVKALGPLFSDSLDAAGKPAGTYTGMIQTNVKIITEGLGGTFTPFKPTPP